MGRFGENVVSLKILIDDLMSKIQTLTVKEKVETVKYLNSIAFDCSWQLWLELMGTENERLQLEPWSKDTVIDDNCSRSMEVCNLFSESELGDGEVDSVLKKIKEKNIQQILKEVSFFKCCTCFEEFDDLKTCKEHVVKHSDSHICSICGALLVSLNPFNGHLQLHIDCGLLDRKRKKSFIDARQLFTYVCISCRANFNNLKLLLKHFKSQHPSVDFLSESNSDLLEVDKSGESCSIGLEDNRVTYTSAEGDQDTCDVATGENDKSTLSITRETSKELGSSVETICKRRRTSEIIFDEANETHQDESTGLNLLNQTDGKQLCCPQCKSTFYYEMALKDHLRLHPELWRKLYTCKFCGLPNKTREQMLQHCQEQHSCYFLNKTEKVKDTKDTSIFAEVQKRNEDEMIDQLSVAENTEMEVITIEDNSTEENILSNETIEKHFQCFQCATHFFKREDLTFHLRHDHHDVNIYDCPLCIFRSNFVSDLSIHISCEHSNEKSFKCKRCLITFSEIRGFCFHLLSCKLS